MVTEKLNRSICFNLVVVGIFYLFMTTRIGPDERGVVPDDLKSARVVPLYKKSYNTDVGNYRPVSILSIVSKVIERVIYDQLEEYLVKNRLLYVLLLQPISTDDVKGKTLHVIYHRLDAANENDIDVTQKTTDIENIHFETSPVRHINQVQVDITPSEILDKDNDNPLFNSPVKVNKTIGGQHSDERSSSSQISKFWKNGYPSKQEDAKSGLQSWEPEYNNIIILSDKKIVIIVAYMRTGSTLTASVFQQYPGTFYVFEPFRSLFDAFTEVITGNKTYTTLKYIHGKERKYTLSEIDHVKFDEINSWLTCHLDSLFIQSLTNDFHKRYTKIMKTFYFCVKGTISRYSRSKNIETCLKTAIHYCHRAPLLTLKFIRLQIKEVIPLLPMYPNMKIIHLVRDPRGIFNSRFRVHAVTRKNYQDKVKKHCSHVDNDLEYSKRTLEKNKDRLKIVRYEDMAESPLETTRSLAEFSGIEFIKPMQDFTRKQTGSTRDTCAYCTQRRNSTATAHKWRTELDSEYARYIYDTCKRSNSILGYLPLTATNMTDSKIPPRKVVDVNKELLKTKTI